MVIVSERRSKAAGPAPCHAGERSFSGVDVGRGVDADAVVLEVA